jgi:phospholipid N-methyltransferase
MDLTTFAIEAVSDLRTVGAIVPGSRYLSQAMLGPLSLERARVVAEAGLGTGRQDDALHVWQSSERALRCGWHDL